MKSRPVYVSTNCLDDRTAAGIRAAARRPGGNRIELSAVRATTGEAVALARELRADGVDVLLHNYFPPPPVPFVLNLASINEAVREVSLRHCESALALSAELGAPFFAAHAGFALDLPPELLGDPAAQRRFCAESGKVGSGAVALEVFADSVDRLVTCGRRLGVQFLVENHVAGDALGADAARQLLLALDAEELVALASRYPTEDFGLLIDVGHLRCTAHLLGFGARDFCDQVAPWVSAFHLSDNDGRRDSHQPFGADAWFLDVLRAHPGTIATLEFDRCSAAEVDHARDLITNS